MTIVELTIKNLNALINLTWPNVPFKYPEKKLLGTLDILKRSSEALNIFLPSSHSTFTSGHDNRPRLTALLGTLRDQGVAIGQCLLLCHLITTSCQKESRYSIFTEVIKTPS